MAQSCRVLPGAGTAGRTRLMRRSLLVTVPSFSPQVVAGSSRSAKAQVAVVDPAAGSYSLVFSQQVLPCATGFAGSIAYVVPVVASGGFTDGPSGFRPEGLGVVDRSHYWTVICP